MKIFVIEGIDYAGKTTLIEQLVNSGLNVRHFREPGSTEVGEACRTLLETQPNIEANAQLCLFYASRLQLLDKIRGDLNNEDCYIVFDRFEASSFVYQVARRGADVELFDSLSRVANLGIEVGYIFLDLDYATYVHRHAEREHQTQLDKFMSEHEFNRLRDDYMTFFNKHPNSILIDAKRAIGTKVEEARAFIRGQ